METCIYIVKSGGEMNTKPLVCRLTPCSDIIYRLKIKCLECLNEYPDTAMNRHLKTYYKCNQYYSNNEEEKKKLDRLLNERENKISKKENSETIFSKSTTRKSLYKKCAFCEDFYAIEEINYHLVNVHGSVDVEVYTSNVD